MANKRNGGLGAPGSDRDNVGFAAVGSGNKLAQVENVGLRLLKRLTSALVATAGIAAVAAAIGYGFPGFKQFEAEAIGRQIGPIAPVLLLWCADCLFGAALLHQPSFLWSYIHAAILGQWAARCAFHDPVVVCRTPGDMALLLAACRLRSAGTPEDRTGLIIAEKALSDPTRYLTSVASVVLVLSRMCCAISKVLPFASPNKYFCDIHTRLCKYFWARW